MPPELPAQAWLLALASLPRIGPRRLRQLNDRWSAAEAFARLASGDTEAAAVIEGGADRQQLQSAAAGLDVARVWGRHLDAAVGVAGPTDPGFPAALADDLDPPGVICWRGDLDVLAGPAVGVIGTRRCSRYGYDVARELGALLAAAGVAVVSGLALGIDAAAHEGALAVDGAPPVGVVGSGLDVVYPKANRLLWERVGERGLLLTEVPLGVGPARWRFPARNRIIAALAPVLVVVESRAGGGSMHTVREALARDRLVMAVPGPIRSATSEGTNRLIAEGATPVCELADVVLALGAELQIPVGAQRADAPALIRAGSPILEAMQWEPISPDELMARTGMEAMACLAELGRLEAEGLISWRGPHVERCSP